MSSEPITATSSAGEMGPSSPSAPEAAAPAPATSAPPAARTERLVPDRAFMARVLASGGEDLRKCMQCATCSAVCELTDAEQPSPRKEMLWAQWGLRDRLMADPDLWLCHQCGDCSRRCPRGARPGDVMAALRREAVIHYATPRAFGRFVSKPPGLFAVVALASAALALAALLWPLTGAGAIELGLRGDRIVFPFWPRLPHWLLGSLFGAVLLVDIVVLVRGARRFARELAARHPGARPLRRPGESLRAAVRRVLWHDDFSLCIANKTRRSHHLLVVYGMLALWLTSLWVVTARWNPLLGGLVYPLAFWSPWKVMANLAGLAVALGTIMMMIERIRRPDTAGRSTYADVLLLGFLLVIVATGFATEALHLLRSEPLRYAAYAVHLVSVLGLLCVLPYCKLAHLVYRTIALIHAERTGRGRNSAETHPGGGE